jgi:rare lipoprotein A
MRYCIVILLLLAATCYAAENAEGLATYYTEASCKREGTSGVRTANGERFDESALTCAMRRRDWGSTFKVTNLDNGKQITVRLNDFGPGRKPSARGVIIDLTPEGFRQLGAGKKGELRVKVEPIRSASPSGKETNHAYREQRQ